MTSKDLDEPASFARLGWTEHGNEANPSGTNFSPRIQMLDVTSNQHSTSYRSKREPFEVVADRYLGEINSGVRPGNNLRMLRFPVWRAWSPKDDYTHDINTYLLRVGGRVIYRMYKSKTFPEVLTQKMIQDFYADILWDKCPHLEDEHDDYRAPRKAVITRRDVEHMAASAAAYTFETMTYERCRGLYQQRAADGRRGGLGSRRGKSTTVRMLEPMGNRKPEQYYAEEAKRLKVSTRTIRRRVAEQKALADITSELDAFEPR